MKTPIENPPIPVGYIGSAEDLYAWFIDTDYRVGGNSTASMEMKNGYCNY